MKQDINKVLPSMLYHRVNLRCSLQNIGLKGFRNFFISAYAVIGCYTAKCTTMKNKLLYFHFMPEFHLLGISYLLIYLLFVLLRLRISVRISSCTQKSKLIYLFIIHQIISLAWNQRADLFI